MKSLRFSIIIPVIIFPAFLHSQQPQFKWKFDFAAPAFGQAAASDIDKDGKLEIVFGTYMNDGEIYALNGEDGSLLWHYNTGGCNDAAPLILDADLDNEPEVIVAASCQPVTFCFDGATGEVEWDTDTGGSDSPPSAADVDIDGKPEILHGQFDGTVICLNGEDGSIAWTKEIDPNGSIQTSPALLDLNNDQRTDVVVATWSFGGNHKVHAFRGDNREDLWISTVPTDVIYHGASFADFDEDLLPELAIGCYDNYVYTINGENGSPGWSFDMGAYNYVGGSVPMADLDNDGKFELIAAGWYKMKSISNTGSQEWNYNIPDYASCFRGPAVSDIDHNGILDVVFGTSEGKVIALRGNNGSLLWTLDLAAEYGDTLDIDHAPLIADFDDDKYLELFIAGGFTDYPNISNDYGRAYLYDLPECTGPQWIMFQHDTARSSVVPLDWLTNLPDSYYTDMINVDVSPNPFSDEINIHFNMMISGDVMISFSDIYGKQLFSFTEKLKGGDSDLRFYSGPFKDGIYIMNIRSGNVQRCFKLIKMTTG